MTFNEVSVIPVEDRFWAKVDKTGPCWLWVGATRDGYGAFKLKGRVVGAHRYSYETSVGPIPDGLTIDHLCRVRHCVNPNHFEVVSRRTNTLRGNSPAAITHRTGVCKRGHPLNGDNLRIYKRAGHPDQRLCRACRRITKANFRARRRKR